MDGGAGEQSGHDGGDAAEWKKVAELRAVLEAQDPAAKEEDDCALRRFLRAREHNIDKASTMFLKYLSWTRATKPRGSIADDEVRGELVQEKLYMQGFDKKGRPMVYLFLARHFPAKRDLDEFKRYVVYILDNTCTRMDWHTLSSSSEDDDDYVTSQLPIMECTEWSGLALNQPCRCEHGPPCERFVAFQSIDTGRRFLACAKKDASKCNFVKWVDNEWPIPLKQGLARIWSMYEEENTMRLRQQVTNVEENLKFLEDKRKIENDLRSFKIDFAKMVADKEDVVTQLNKAHRAIGDLREELEKKKLADKAGTSIHQVLRAKAEKERDQMKQEKAMWMEEMEQMKQEKGK